MTGPRAPRWTARLPLLVGFVALFALVGGLGVWSVRTKIAGAVIASGTIMVESNRQVVQHPEGGVVGAILARNGQRVAAGDPLVRLDDTLLRSELAIIEAQLVEIGARKARLQAERDGSDSVVIPDKLTALIRGRAEAQAQIDGQLNLFVARRDTLQKEISQTDERIAQTRNQIEGAEAQLAALAIQQELIGEELAAQETLLEKGLVQLQRVSSLRREAARLAGEIGKLTSDIAQFRGAIAGLEIEKLKLSTGRREQAIVELRDLQFNEIEYAERQLNLLERLSRLDVRAPVSGVVYGSEIFALQSVIRPAEPMMYIIPQDQPLIVAARVDAIHVDQVYIGQDASLRFPAFDQRLTPEIRGYVSDVSADVFEDELTGASFYRVELLPEAAELPKLGDQVLLPGMPVEAFLKTNERTPLSYLTKPMTDYFRRALREG